jgi:ornithine decarboxylase
MRKFDSVNKLVNDLKPVDPVYCIRPNSIKIACNWFKKNFPGKILYAVKTNPNEIVIKEIKDSGIDKFDIASIEEIKIIKKIYKSRENILLLYELLGEFYPISKSLSFNE